VQTNLLRITAIIYFRTQIWCLFIRCWGKDYSSLLYAITYSVDDKADTVVKSIKDKMVRIDVFDNGVFWFRLKSKL